MIKDLEKDYTLNDILKKYGRCAKPSKNYKTGSVIISNTDKIPYICDGCKKEFLCEFRLIKNDLKKKHYCSFKCKLKFVESQFSKQSVKTKIKNTWTLKYGVDHPWKDKSVRKKCEDTNIKLYGDRIPMRTKIVQNRVKETTNKNFGVNWGFQTKNNRESCNSPIAHKKRHITQKKNKTYAKSKPEDFFMFLLRKKHIKYRRHITINVIEKRLDFIVFKYGKNICYD